MEVEIRKGLEGNPHFYVVMGAESAVVLRISRVGLFKLGLLFYHVGMGNRELDHAPERLEVADLTVYRLQGR